MVRKYKNGFNKHLHIQKEEFEDALNKVNSVNELCKYLDKSKSSVYTYAYRFNIPLKRRWLYKKLRSDGYITYVSDNNHRRIMEKHLGRKLDPKLEQIHHIDGEKTNNDLDNLIIMNVSEHSALHTNMKKLIFELLKIGIVEFDRIKKMYTYKR